MEKIKLQNVVFGKENPELYFHEKEREILLDGYFNLFDIANRKKYTDLKDVVLEIRAKRYDTLFLMHDDELIAEHKLGDEEIAEIELPYQEYDDGVFWFKLKKSDQNPSDSKIQPALSLNMEEGDCGDILEAAYYGLIDSKRETNICITMCTFKREEYVKQNLSFVENQVLSSEEVAEHLSMYVVDNGKTLAEDPYFRKMEKKSPWLRIIPNKNAGGASGFTRGMLEAIRDRKDKGYTHILLMDDDVTIMEDLFMRLYGHLCTLRDEYKDIRVGGELLRKDFPSYLNARGEWSENYLIQNDCHLVDLSDRREAVAMLLKNRNDKKLYSGWWCACYSLDMVENSALPMPLFIHDDDISYEREHAENRLMFLNGISVWHNGFEFGNYGANQYYHIRNKLIASSIYEPEIKSTKAAKWVAKCMIALLLSYRYKEIELISRAVTDFIRGPEWLYNADAEKINSKVRAEFSKDAMKADDFSEIPETVRKRIENYRKNYSVEDLKKYNSENRTGGHIISKLTFNGWILPTNKKYKEMTLLDTPFEAFRSKNVVLFDPVDRKSIILKKDYGKFFASLILIIRAVGRIKANYDQVAKRYRDGEQSITTLESWKKYLDIE
ncbi:glycosyltransferase family 2 protein [Oribacterium sp. FC2011]|uniref:glycosyltransferase family 2 protein n=1 Tax=Oribacterium sp. FC2011 TaxID=1408311 RepID=UPI0004E17C39|nr:glycosyltransferase [Oribacterium sp. FC2011]